MYRSPGIDDDRLKWILSEINGAQATLDDRIALARALPDTEPSKVKRIIRLNAMKREVNTSFTNLDKSVARWAEQDVPSMYKSGWLVGATQTGTGFDFTLPHREALDIISQSAYDDVALRLQQVNTKFGMTTDMQVLYEGMDPGQILAIQDKSRSAVAQALLTGEADPRKVARVLADELWEDGVTIVDGGGNHWQMETYTRMLVRTKSANAYNAGSLNKYVEEGVSRVTVYDGVVDDEACAEANGKTWSIKYATEHAIEHPNCRRAFAPKPGSGEANDPDDSDEAAQARERSRIKTAGRAWAGTTLMQQFIQSLRHPEQFDTSRVLSTFAVGAVEQLTGVPLAFVDDFIAGLLSQPLHQIDRMIEETINPALFAAGFARNLPPAEELFKIKDPSRLVRVIQRAMIEADAGVSHIGTHPQVRAASRTIGDHAETALIAAGYETKRRVFVQHLRKAQFLRVIDIVAIPHIATNRYGRIVSEVLQQWARGNDFELKQAFADAATTIDHMLFTRKAANDLFLDSAQDAFLVRKDIDSKIAVVRQYIFEGLFGVEDPVLLARIVKAEGIDYQPFVHLSEDERYKALNQMLADLEALRAYADQRVIELVALEALNSGASAEAIEATIRRLALDLDEGGVTDLSAFRLTRTWGTRADIDLPVLPLPATGGRKLLAEVTPPVRGTPSAAAARSMASVDDIEQVAKDLERALPVHISAPFNQEAWDEFAEIFMALYRKGQIDPADPSVQNVLGYITRTGVATELNTRVLGGMWPPDPTATHRVTKLEFLGLVAAHMESFSVSNGKMFYGASEITPTSQEFIALREALSGIKSEFFLRTDRWLDDITAGSDPLRVLRHIGADAAADPKRAVSEIFQRFRTKVLNVGNSQLDFKALVGSSPPNSRNIEVVLRNIYGAANVVALGEVGANGKLYKVIDQDGTTFVVKRVIYSGTGTADAAITSYALSDWVDNYLFGGHAAVPVRVIKLNEDGEYLGLMPFFDADVWRDVNWVDEIPDSALRRTRLFDMVGQEMDGHGGNFMYDSITGVSLSIDNEMSVYASGIVVGDRLLRHDGFGITGVHFPSTAVDKRAARAWLGAGDERGLANGVPVRLVALTDEEFDAIEDIIGSQVTASAAGTAQTMPLGPFPLVVDVTPSTRTGRKITMIAGRMSPFHATDYLGVAHPHMVHTVFISGDEAKKLRALAAMSSSNPTASPAGVEIFNVIHDMVFNVWSDTTRAETIAKHQFASDANELVVSMVASAVDTLAIRARRLLDAGVVNENAINRYVGSNGVIVEVGDTVDAVLDSGDLVQGLVISIFRDDLGDINVQYVTGIGLGKTAAELKTPGVVKVTKEIVDELFVDLDHVSHRQHQVLGEVLDDSLSEHKRLRAFEKSPLEESRAPIRTAEVPRVDEFGVQIGVTEEWIPIFTPDGFEDGVRVIGKKGDEGLLTWAQIVESDVLHNVIDEELAKIPPAYRPREIVIHFNQLVTSDGRSAFGYVEADTRIMHVSAQALFQDMAMKASSVSGKRAIDVGDIFVDVTVTSAEQLTRRLNIDGFRELVQHELGHTIEVGVEEQTRAKLVTAVWDNFFNERGYLPDTRAELISLIEYDQLIPVGFPALKYDDLVDAFIASRVELLEDIINTNMAVAADEIFRLSMEVGDMPKWMARAYNDVLREKPNAYHEFFAEVFARVLAEGGDEAALQKVAREMFAGEIGDDKLRRLRGLMTRTAGDRIGVPSGRLNYTAAEVADFSPEDAVDASRGLAQRLTEAAIRDTNWTRTDGRRAGAGLGAQLDVEPIARFRQSDEWVERIETLGGTVDDIYEIESDLAGAQVFHDAILRSKESHKYGASVSAYDVEDYTEDGMRLFLYGDGSAGFAITADGQVISVFNGTSSNRMPLHSFMPLAVHEGATRADAFDTVLPAFYADFGFHPTTRLKWNDAYAPDDWDYPTFKKFNGGRPDVVFLRLDPERVGVPYVKGAGKYVDDYDDGLASTLPDPLGVDELRALLDRGIGELPEMIGWDIEDQIYQEWLRRVLDARAVEILPRNRSVNRRLWKLKEPVGFDLEHLADDINAQLVSVDSYGGGATIHVMTGEIPDHGTAVARHANERIIENVQAEDVAKEIERFLNRAANRKFLNQEQWYLGMWIEKDGTFTIDVTMMFDDEIDAAIFGFKEQQRSAFNFTTGKLEKYLDEYDDFNAWFAVRGREILKENGVELTEDLYNAVTQRVGAAYVNLADPVKREIRGKGGKHLPVGMEALKSDSVGTAKIHYNAKTKYVIGVADENGDLIPTGERLVITKESIKENLTRVLEYAENEYGLVDRSLPDKEWLVARNIAIKGVDVPQSEIDEFIREVREAYDLLDRMGVTAPGKLLDAGQYHDPRLVTFSIESGTKMRKYGVSQIGGKVAPNGASTRGYTHINRSWKDLPGTMATSRQETIIHEIAHQLDPRGVLGGDLRRLGFDPKDISPYASLNDDEFFAEAFLALVTGRASPELVEAMLGYSFDTVEKLTTTGILDVDRGAALRILHRFYEDWNRKYKAVAEETGIPMKRLVGVAAIISPGMYAESNRDAAAFMIKTIADDPKIWGARMTRYKKWLQRRADNIRIESRKKNNGRITQKASKAAKEVEQMIREAHPGRLSEWSDTETAYGLAFLARDSGLMISETRSMTLTGRYGMRQVIDATMVILGTSTLDDALGDTKTRSFFNNIMDPKDIYRVGDVTVDFHMDNAAGMVIGMQNLPSSMNVTVLGMNAGLRPMIGDIVRELFDEGWGDRVHSDSPAEIQEVIWAIIRAATSVQRRGEKWFGELKTVMLDPEWNSLSNEDLLLWILSQGNL